MKNIWQMYLPYKMSWLATIQKDRPDVVSFPFGMSLKLKEVVDSVLPNIILTGRPSFIVISIVDGEGKCLKYLSADRWFGLYNGYHFSIEQRDFLGYNERNGKKLCKWSDIYRNVYGNKNMVILCPLKDFEGADHPYDERDHMMDTEDEQSKFTLAVHGLENTNDPVNCNVQVIICY